MELVNKIDNISLEGFTEKEITLFYGMLTRVANNLNKK